ncbi:restriction endonuclease subunit S [Catellatospora bangladeshensis]|uniref:Type I restriction-modification system subunit S n=1 Tax=Catellatospora bangladeshensis TaxID=310355 RepID=A0A8J3J9B2_9ACTN|nr:restriction endonuclease subunit S [Catellatospora bangladeshensis]GIF80702.1 type I restriction-modification system subunit S [Catellatospora bangladeshensis]
MLELILGDSLEVLIDNRGKNPPYTENGIPVISAKAVKNGRINLGEARRISRETYENWMQVEINRHDVILTSEAPLGECALVESDEPLAIAQRLYALRGRKGVLDSRYLYYAFKTKSVQADLYSRASGSTVAGIRQPELLKVRIPDPGYTTQMAIAEILGALDDKIGVNERIAETYEALLAARFVQYGWDDEPGLLSNTVPLMDLISFNPTYPTPRGIAAYVDMAAVPTSRGRVTSPGRRVATSGMKFRNGDTIMARITPCLENGKTAFIDFLDADEIAVGSTEFIVLRSKPGIPQHFTYAIARSPRFRQHAISNMVGTSGRQRCPADVLPGFRIVRPDEADLQKFGADAQAMFNHVRSLDAESIHLAGLRDSLLPGLISGALRLKDAECLVSDAA